MDISCAAESNDAATGNSYDLHHKDSYDSQLYGGSSHALPVGDIESTGPPTLNTLEDPPRRTNVKRREIEARRFSGNAKESIEEYLLQFDLTSKRNRWDDEEKSTALLCALDGPARGILAEFDDPLAATYIEIKEALLRRFGPTRLIEVHENALAQLRLQKGQNIREIAHEIQRLVKKVYPDVVGPPRERLAVKHLINAIPDKEATFYIKEKEPHDVMDACKLYERFTALVNDDPGSRRSGVRGVNDGRSDKALPQPDASVMQKQVSDAIAQLTAATTQQLQRLSVAIEEARPARPSVIPPQALVAPGAQPLVADAILPRPPPAKPCPRCKMHGHWARDCPQQPQQPPPVLGACFRCGNPGHTYKQCTAAVSLNIRGPMPAPGIAPRPSLLH